MVSACQSQFEISGLILLISFVHTYFSIFILWFFFKYAMCICNCGLKFLARILLFLFIYLFFFSMFLNACEGFPMFSEVCVSVCALVCVRAHTCSILIYLFFPCFLKCVKASWADD